MKLKSGIGLTFASSAVFLALASVTGCGGGSGGSVATTNSGTTDGTPGTVAAMLQGQAVDGYLVNGDVFCDNKANGKTKAAGRYDCESGTKVVRVRHGLDVGFSETETSSGVPFYGEVAGPASYPFVSPLSTLVLELAGGEDGFDESKVADVLAMLRKVFNVGELDLHTNPKERIQYARVLAQITEVANTFARDPESFRKVCQSIANLVRERHDENRLIDFAGGDQFANDMRRLNDILRRDHSGLHVADMTELDRRINATKDTCQKIEGTDNADNIDDVVKNAPVVVYDLGLQEARAIVNLHEGTQTYPHSLLTFQDPAKDSLGRYSTVVSRGIDRVSYDPSALDVQSTLDRKPVEVGIEVKSTDAGDPRELSIVASGVLVSMTAGDPQSIRIEVPDDLVWFAKGVKKDGTVTSATIDQEGKALFDGQNNGININFNRISSWLSKRGYLDPSKATGNFAVSMVINGVKLTRIRDDKPVVPSCVTVSAGEGHTVTGSGLCGYVTVTPSTTGTGSGSNSPT